MTQQDIPGSVPVSPVVPAPDAPAVAAAVIVTEAVPVIHGALNRVIGDLNAVQQESAAGSGAYHNSAWASLIEGLLEHLPKIQEVLAKIT